MPMIIANVSRSRRSCRSSLTTIEPSLRRLTCRLLWLHGGRDEDVLEIRRRRPHVAADVGGAQPRLDAVLEISVLTSEHAQRRADLRDCHDALKVAQRVLRAPRLARRDEP